VSPAAAETEARAAGFDPLESYPGYKKQWRCRCVTCGNEVVPTLGGIRAGRGCRYCAGQGPIRAEDAVTQMRAAGMEPLEPYPGITQPWRCRTSLEPWEAMR
jgi:hypothetical protein